MESRVIQFSEEQAAAIDANLDRFVVLASAGSGKTSVLVQRYVRLVQQRVAPDQILTITFTKKAAAEMKDRIVARLRELDLLEEAQIAETGPIQTIHSFCERMLRENVLECDLDPEFEILEGPAKTAMTLQAIRDAIVAAPEETPIADRVIRDLAGKTDYYSGGSPYARLERAIQDVMESLRSAGQNRDVLREAYRDPARLEPFWEEKILADIPDEGVREAFGEIYGGSFSERLTQAYRRADKRMPSLYRVKATLDDDIASLEHTCGLVSLAIGAWTNLEIAMRQSNRLDFTALESEAVALLERSEATRERLRMQYPVVMVDEVQDVNPVQFRLINAIESDSRMYVGDIKQSIYAFRHADVDHFGREIESISKLHLTKNYRSTDGILRYVDALFDRAMNGYQAMAPTSAKEQTEAMDLEADGRVEEPNYEGVEHWRLTKADWRGLASYVKQLIEEGVAPGSIAVLVRDNRTAGQIQFELQLQEIASRVIGGSERFYARLEVRDLANAIRVSADPYDDFAMLATLRSPMVGVSMDTIVALSQSPPVYDSLESIETPIADDRLKIDRFLAWFKPLRMVADRLSAWEVLATIFSESGYLEALARRPQADQRIANVRKLLTLAAEQPEMGPLDYAESIRNIQNFKHREGEAPFTEHDDRVVNILTIHKSKGLEFDVVVLPQTDKALTPTLGQVLVDAARGFVVAKGGAASTLPFAHLGDLKKRREVAESMRVLYVATTRARHRLCVCLYPATSRDTISKRIHATFGDSNSTIRERNLPTNAQTST